MGQMLRFDLAVGSVTSMILSSAKFNSLRSRNAIGALPYQEVLNYICATTYAYLARHNGWRHGRTS